MGDDDIANSITLTGQGVIKQARDIANSYASQLAGKEIELTVAGDTDSCYLSLTPLFKELDLKFTENGKLTSDAYKYADLIDNELNTKIKQWGYRSLGSKDPRFVFKREVMADSGIFLEKKRYVLHVLDDEGFRCNKFKYVGVEVVRTTMPKPIKPLVKKIIETLITTQNVKKTNDILMEVYETFKNLPINDIASVSGINNLEHYSSLCTDLHTAKGMPKHVKAAYYYNYFIDQFGLQNTYEKISTGDKIRYFSVQQPNKYGIKVIGYKYTFPKEFIDVFKPDIDTMFETLVYAAVERYYNTVKWIPRKPGEQIQTDFDDLFA